MDDAEFLTSVIQPADEEVVRAVHQVAIRLSVKGLHVTQIRFQFLFSNIAVIPTRDEEQSREIEGRQRMEQVMLQATRHLLNLVIMEGLVNDRHDFHLLLIPFEHIGCGYGLIGSSDAIAVQIHGKIKKCLTGEKGLIGVNVINIEAMLRKNEMRTSKRVRFIY